MITLDISSLYSPITAVFISNMRTIPDSRTFYHLFPIKSTNIKYLILKTQLTYFLKYQNHKVMWMKHQ